MSRTLEAIFRRPLRLLMMIVLFPIVGLAIAYFLPRSYQTTATLWALRRYEVIGATGTESDLESSPAETQATALTELLQSRTFTLAVAKSTRIKTMFDSTTQSNPEQLTTAITDELTKHVLIVAAGYDTFTISYTNHDPVLAQQVVASVIKNYGIQSQNFSTIEGQQLLQSYQTQLAKANSAANDATQAETQYIINHPNLTSTDRINDPQYALLDAQAQQARTTVQNIEAEIDTVNQEISAQGNSGAGLYKVLDTPKVASTPVSRVKDLAIGGGGGFGVALLACLIYLVILVRQDRAVYTIRDLQKVTPLPIALQIPLLEVRTRTFLLEGPQGA